MMVDSCPIVVQIVTVAGITMITKSRKKGREMEGYNKDKRAKCATKRIIAKTLQIRVEIKRENSRECNSWLWRRCSSALSSSSSVEL